MRGELKDVQVNNCDSQCECRGAYAGHVNAASLLQFRPGNFISFPSFPIYSSTQKVSKHPKNHICNICKSTANSVIKTMIAETLL